MKSKGEKILFIGDSITDCRRREDFYPYGNGYVRIFRDLLISEFPEKNFEIINKGIDGDTTVDLQQRWEDDVIYNNPDILSILIGINDLHRVLRKVELWEEYTPENFRKRYDSVLKRTSEKLDCKIILMEPFYITRDKTDNFRGIVLKELADYIEIVEEMSKKYETELIKLHRIFQNHLKYRESEILAPEPVHPNQTGHTIIANEILKIFRKWNG